MRDGPGERLVVLRSDGATTAQGSVRVRGGTVTVTASGTYRVQGTSTDGQLVVDCDDRDSVRLILDGVALTNRSGPALWVRMAEAVSVEVAAGTESRLQDGTRYELPDPPSDEPDAALFSTADLRIGGSGTLVVEGRYNDGISSKQGLVVESGTLIVSAFDDGIRGDSLAVRGGAVSVRAGDDGLKGDKARRGGAGSVSIDGGSVWVDAGDDAINADGTVAIQGGTLRLRSGDDAVHADTDLTISGGELTVEASYEGLDGALVSIAGGTIAITSRDDGINVAGDGRRVRRGRWRSGRPPERPRPARRGRRSHRLVISGGSIVIDATGDGLDSNGTIEITGGTILVYGPTVDFDGALDANRSFTISGGSLVAGGSAAGSTVRLTAADGTEVVSYRPARAVESLVVSTPAVRSGSPLDVVVDGTTIGTVSPRLSGTTAQGDRPSSGHPRRVKARRGFSSARR